MVRGKQNPRKQAERAAEGGSMTTRKDLVQDMEDAETILLALDGLRDEIPDKMVIRAIVRCLWHILEYLIRRAHE
jgi:hypothetical protein